jgi:Tfp pilus assembly protein PilF
VTAYTLCDVARICGVPPARLRYWQRTKLLEAPRRGRSRVAFEFRDLVSVRSLISLLDHGVPLRRIRRSVEFLRERMPEVERPLGALRLWHEGSGRVVLRRDGVLVEPDGQLVLDLGPGDGGGAVAALEEGRGAEERRARALQEAEAWFEQGCTLDSDRATYAEAIEAYTRALEAAPGFADAHCNLGTVYYNQGRRARARHCFEQAIALEPRHLEAQINLATIFEEDGRNQAALRHYRLALEADPLCADTHVCLAFLYEKLALTSRARGHWRRYLQLDPAGAWAAVAHRHMDG